MHQYQEVAKNFLVEYVVETRKIQFLNKRTMSMWLHIDPRSYTELEKGRYGLSAAALLCFQCHLDDSSILEMVRRFRALLLSGRRAG